MAAFHRDDEVTSPTSERPRMLRIEVHGLLHDWFDVEELGDMVKAPGFNVTLRENIARYFGVPVSQQAVYDEDGLLATAADLSRALQRYAPKLYVYNLNEIGAHLREKTSEQLALIDHEVEQTRRHFEPLTQTSTPVSAQEPTASSQSRSAVCAHPIRISTCEDLDTGAQMGEWMQFQRKAQEELDPPTRQTTPCGAGGSRLTSATALPEDSKHTQDWQLFASTSCQSCSVTTDAAAVLSQVSSSPTALHNMATVGSTTTLASDVREVDATWSLGNIRRVRVVDGKAREEAQRMTQNWAPASAQTAPAVAEAFARSESRPRHEAQGAACLRVSSREPRPEATQKLQFGACQVELPAEQAAQPSYASREVLQPLFASREVPQASYRSIEARGEVLQQPQNGYPTREVSSGDRPVLEPLQVPQPNGFRPQVLQAPGALRSASCVREVLQAPGALQSASCVREDKCVGCGSVFLPDAAFCRHCGRKRDNAPVVRASSAQAPALPGMGTRIEAPAMARVLAPEELPAEPQVPCRVAVSPRPMTPPRSAGGAAWASPPSVLHLPGQCAGFAQARLGSTSILRLPGDAANRSLSRPRAKQEDARYVTPGNCMTAASLKDRGWK